jgi:cobalt transport protein ATP-binding subunit
MSGPGDHQRAITEHDHAHSHADGLHEHPHAAAPGAGDLDARWVDIEHLHYTYPDGFEALRGIDLRIARAERVALVGPNGAGKSTLMLHLNGTHIATRGSVRIGGELVDRASIRRIRAAVGLVFQDPDDQLFSPTVFDDVAFGPLHMGMADQAVHATVESALASVDMVGFEQRLPHHLSIGQRKRVALATVLSMRPSVLVFDEPSAGLDPRGRRQLIDLLATMSQTLIVATHDMRLAAEVTSRTVIMDEGVIVAEGPTSDVLSNDTLLERHGLERP